MRKKPDSVHELEVAKKVAEFYARYPRKHRVLNGEAQRWLDQCEPKSWYDDNGKIVRSEMANMLAMLVGSVQVPSNIDIPVFTMFLLDDVMMFEPSFAALAMTCNKLRVSKKFISIAEVLDELEKQQVKWNRRTAVLMWIEDVHAKLIETIAEVEKLHEARRQLEHKPRVPMPEVRPTVRNDRED